jgi:hypothetical protein
MGHWGGVCEVLLVDFLLYTRSSFLLFGRFPRWMRFGSIFRRIFGRALEYGNVVLLTHIFFFSLPSITESDSTKDRSPLSHSRSSWIKSEMLQGMRCTSQSMSCVDGGTRRWVNCCA